MQHTGISQTRLNCSDCAFTTIYAHILSKHRLDKHTALLSNSADAAAAADDDAAAAAAADAADAAAADAAPARPADADPEHFVAGAGLLDVSYPSHSAHAAIAGAAPAVIQAQAVHGGFVGDVAPAAPLASLPAPQTTKVRTGGVYKPRVPTGPAIIRRSTRVTTSTYSRGGKSDDENDGSAPSKRPKMLQERKPFKAPAKAVSSRDMDSGRELRDQYAYGAEPVYGAGMKRTRQQDDDVFAGGKQPRLTLMCEECE